MQHRSNGHSNAVAAGPTPPPNPFPAADELELLTAEELAELWKTTPEHIRRLAHKQGLPFRYVGRYMRFRESEARAWLDSPKTTSRNRPR